jgi:hypothetical protein
MRRLTPPRKGARGARTLLLATSAILVLALGATPASAGHFNLFGSFWDTKDAGDTAGGGIGLGFPLGQRWGIDLRASYYEELTNEGLEAIFDDDETVFQRRGLQVLPLEIGLRYNFSPGNRANFYLGGGGTYYLLDSDFGDVDDEVGGYALLGVDLGNPQGVSFFVEGFWRIAEAKVSFDPESLDDIDDIDLVNGVPVDLDGLGINAGLSWRFGSRR